MSVSARLELKPRLNLSLSANRCKTEPAAVINELAAQVHEIHVPILLFLATPDRDLLQLPTFLKTIRTLERLMHDL